MSPTEASGGSWGKRVARRFLSAQVRQSSTAYGGDDSMKTPSHLERKVSNYFQCYYQKIRITFKTFQKNLEKFISQIKDVNFPTFPNERNLVHVANKLSIETRNKSSIQQNKINSFPPIIQS